MISSGDQKNTDNDIQTEDGQTRRNDEINVVEASGTNTYILKIGRQQRNGQINFMGQEQAHTRWKWADKEKWSG